MIQQGFRPAGTLLGAVRTMSVPTSFPSFIEPFPVMTSPVFPNVFPVTAPEVVTPAPVVAPAAAPSSSYTPMITLLAAGGIAVAGVALLISALGPKS